MRETMSLNLDWDCNLPPPHICSDLLSECKQPMPNSSRDKALFQNQIASSSVSSKSHLLWAAADEALLVFSYTNNTSLKDNLHIAIESANPIYTPQRDFWARSCSKGWPVWPEWPLWTPFWAKQDGKHFSHRIIMSFILAKTFAFWSERDNLASIGC